MGDLMRDNSELPAKHIFNVDVSLLLEQIKNNADCFGEHSYRKDIYVHSGMDDIWVRYNHIKNLGESFNDEHDSVWYPVIYKLTEVLPIVFKLMYHVNGERLGGVLITKIPSGGMILPHVDTGWHTSYYDKFYVPIQNGKGSKFCWENMEIEPEAGEVWKFDNSVTHWVENNSDQDRIAMIVCIKTLEGSLRQLIEMMR